MFNLDDCFNYSLAHSRDYQLRKEDLYISALDVALARHQFEPQFFAQTTAGITSQGEVSDYQAALSASQSVGVRQKLPIGGEIVASGIATAVNQVRGEVDTASSAQAVLAANIPLLRGAQWAGGGSQEGLIQAERNLVYEVREFERIGAIPGDRRQRGFQFGEPAGAGAQPVPICAVVHFHHAADIGAV